MAENSKVYFGKAKRFLNQFYVKKPGATRLSPIPNWKWGYVIYRTVYTLQSDTVWESIVAKLEAYMLREVDRDLWLDPAYMAIVSKFYAPIDPSINAEIREHMQNHILNDKALFEGASIDQVRTYFKEFWNSWYKKEDITGMPHKCFCILIDEEVLQSLLNAPEPTRNPNQKLSLTPGFVKVINKDFDNTSTWGRDDYQGWMKASIIYLMTLFMELQLKDICPYHDEETGDFPIWDTGSPKIKPGHNQDLIGGTQRGVQGRNPPPAPQARDTPPIGDLCTAPWLLEYLKKKEERLTRERDSP